MFHETADAEHNVTEPTGDLAGSGWSTQGRWGAFLGTPVAPGWFLTAKHVGGVRGQGFILNGVTYATFTFRDHVDSDLRLVRICGVFPEYAPLYTNRNEAGQGLTVFGRGTLRGEAVVSADDFGVRTNGWRWGGGDGRMRWGRNVVKDIVDGEEELEGAPGDYLKVTFDGAGVGDECHLSRGDSGGAVFIQEGGLWKLAGINYAVDGPYSVDGGQTGFDAAIFDERGLYRERKGTWTLTSPMGMPQPGAFYATRISTHVAWIETVLAEGEGLVAPVVESAMAVAGPYVEDPDAVVDVGGRTMTLPVADSTRFHRLRACSPVRITSVRLMGAQLVLTYE
jgi:hypothetical protein